MILEQQHLLPLVLVLLHQASLALNRLMIKTVKPKTGISAELRQRRYLQSSGRSSADIFRAAAFDNEDSILKSLAAQGQAAARGVAGRSAQKVQQSQLAEFGRDQAILAASLMSAERKAQSDISAINKQFEDALIRADTNRMLPPVPKPIPPVPLATPDMEFMLPPELQEFDFGPKPIKGVASYTSPGLSFANSVVSALPALAGGIASMSQGTLGGGGTTYGSGAQAPITGGTDYSGAFSGGNYSPMNPFG